MTVKRGSSVLYFVAPNFARCVKKCVESKCRNYDFKSGKVNCKTPLAIVILAINQ